MSPRGEIITIEGHKCSGINVLDMVRYTDILSTRRFFEHASITSTSYQQEHTTAHSQADTTTVSIGPLFSVLKIAVTRQLANHITDNGWSEGSSILPQHQNQVHFANDYPSA